MLGNQLTVFITNYRKRCIHVFYADALATARSCYEQSIYTRVPTIVFYLNASYKLH